MELAPKYRMLIIMAISMVVTWSAFIPLINIARRNRLMDNPGSRKLQHNPVPVLGGAAVFLGVTVGLCCFKTMLSYTSLFAVLGAMIVMLYVGMMDDILSLKPSLRLVTEVVVCTLLVYGTRFAICNFQGIFGTDHIPGLISIPLSVFAGVGIINAINMIDGIDGLVSGFGIMACTLFGVVFFIGRDYSFAALAMVTAGALIPFFLHNVFGEKSKMYIGDGGSMMLGLILFSMVTSLTRYVSNYQEYITYNFGLIPFSLAVLSLPVFDTLRVMTGRIMRGTSPFKADQTHLHHVFIHAGFSHLATPLSLITLDLAVVAIWSLVWIGGASVPVQLCASLAAGIFLTMFPAIFISWHAKRGTRFYTWLRGIAAYTHVENTRPWRWLRGWLDRERSGGLAAWSDKEPEEVCPGIGEPDTGKR